MWAERWLSGGARPLALDGRSAQVLGKQHLALYPSNCQIYITRKRNCVRSAITPVAPVPQTASSASQELASADSTIADEKPNLFAEEALVADYQYTLRYYRALKRQVGPWQASFLAQHQRQPTAKDATVQGSQEFAALYDTFLEVRTRLLVELPRLKARLEATARVEAVAGAADLPHAGALGVVNANGASSSWGLLTGGGAATAASSSGASAQQQHRSPASSPHHPTPQHPQQQVDSVATWLRADRYCRQRAVAEAEAAEPGGPITSAPSRLLHPYGTPPSTLLYDTSTVAQQSAYQGASSGMETGISDGSTSGCFADGSLLRELGTGGSNGSDGSEAWMPYQPVVQLPPLPYRPVAAPASGAPATGVTSKGGERNCGHESTTPATAVPTADVGCSCGAGSGVEGSVGQHEQSPMTNISSSSSREDGAVGRMMQDGPLLPSQPTLPPQTAAGSHSPSNLTSLLSAAPAMTHSSPSACTGGPERPLPGVTTCAAVSAAGQHPMQGEQLMQGEKEQQQGAPSWRLEADVHLAADIRAKNALMAALQYKRTGKSGVTFNAGTAASGLGPANGTGIDGVGGSGMEMRRREGDTVVTSGGEGSVAPTAPGCVDVEVQRGDAAGAYVGRNRRSDALPEAFLVCP